MMSAKVKKFNKYQIGQGRNFVITNSNLYNFNVKSKCISPEFQAIWFSRQFGLATEIGCEWSELCGRTRDISEDVIDFWYFIVLQIIQNLPEKLGNNSAICFGLIHRRLSAQSFSKQSIKDQLQPTCFNLFSYAVVTFTFQSGGLF